MKDFLRQRWFLGLLLGGIGIACLRPGWFAPLTVRLDTRAVVAVALFLIAWTLESRSLWHAAVRPFPAAWAALISYGLLPAVAWLTGRFLPEDFRLGLLIIAAVPCTLASAVLWTRMAGGNEATALFVILLTTGTSWLVTPAWLSLAGTQTAVQTGDMMRELVLVLIVPVALGQLTRLIGPLARAARQRKVGIGVISKLLVLAVIVKAAVEVRLRLGTSAGALSAGAFLAALGVCLGTHGTALAFGFLSGKVLRFSAANRAAVAIAGSQKTLPVALFLFDRYFKAGYPLAAVALVFYHVGQLIVDTFFADALATRTVHWKTLDEDPVT